MHPLAGPFSPIRVPESERSASARCGKPTRCRRCWSSSPPISRPRGWEGRLAALRAEVAEIERAADARDIERFVHHDLAFHQIIVDAADHRSLRCTWEALGVDGRAGAAPVGAQSVSQCRSARTRPAERPAYFSMTRSMYPPGRGRSGPTQ